MKKYIILIVAGYGGSAILVSRVGEYFLAQQISPRKSDQKPVNAGIRTVDLFRDRNFWGLVCGIFPCLGIGLMIIGGMMEGKKVILLSLISTSTVCLAAPFAIKDNVSFYIFAVLAGFNYGACLVLYAAEIAHHYGTAQMGTIYSTLFLSNGIAGFLAPPVAGKIYDAIGSIHPRF